MQTADTLSLFESGPSGDVEPPLEAYAAQVRNLFANVVPLAVAAGCAAFVGGVAATRTGSWLLGAATALQLVAGVYRLAVHRGFVLRPPRIEDGRPAFVAWERRFAVGAIATAAGFGAMCLAAFVLTDDPICQLLVDATSIGFTVGAIGRNFARRKVTLWQIGLPLASIIAGASAHGGFAYYTLAAFTALYWLAAREITNNLARGGQRLLMLALDNARLAGSLAQQNQRLDAALSNMSHGLCLIDAEGRLVLANRRMSDLFGLPEARLAHGVSLADLLSSAAPGRRVAGDAVARLVDALGRLDGPRREAALRLEDGSVISWSENPAEGGGAVVIFEDVTERERARARAEYLSTHDDLTGLPNRFMFDRLLREAVRASRSRGGSFGLVFVDLDRFKFVNDSLGHAAGDKLLLETAGRLKADLSVGDVVARLGGDEFVVILHDVEPAQALASAGALARALAEPCSIEGHELAVSASIGLAMFPNDADDEQDLIKCADAAMYRVKQEGKNGVRRFEPAIGAPSIRRLELENDLRHALERGQFVLHYQPKCAVSAGAMSGVEALLRWRHPELGLLAPDKFIDLAEETGLIVSIGRWVIETACRQVEAWRRAGVPDVRVAVNLSPRQFASEGLVQIIGGALEASGTPARLLEVEITESVAMRDPARSEAMLRRIRAMGVTVSIDDFGAGHSSMARLKLLSIDAIKIDRAFVRGLAIDARDRAIVEAICALGKALCLRVVGEGVETAEQEALLAEIGCDEIQGFLFARPMPPEELPGFVRENAISRLAFASKQLRSPAWGLRNSAAPTN